MFKLILIVIIVGLGVHAGVAWFLASLFAAGMIAASK